MANNLPSSLPVYTNFCSMESLAASLWPMMTLIGSINTEDAICSILDGIVAENMSFCNLALFVVILLTISSVWAMKVLSNNLSASSIMRNFNFWKSRTLDDGSKLVIKSIKRNGVVMINSYLFFLMTPFLNLAFKDLDNNVMFKPIPLDNLRATSQCLTGTCWRTGDQITVEQGNGDGFTLNGGWLIKPKNIQVGQKLRRDCETGFDVVERSNRQWDIITGNFGLIDLS
ncbi:hypothetical protein WICPIJ_002624 [Wickerhamomyces pijperi]|uniref:Uncharacterized protein n=1 Tax=Wickerhamomyces pijperi TaxID=599730 RepID=A0A9P8QBJ3_WICPI|nr:hypothetical protein WICPIJ_002624 [Wickerhamomyces pijperi]